jgi:hypothetical protein
MRKAKTIPATMVQLSTEARNVASHGGSSPPRKPITPVSVETATNAILL